MIVVLACAVRKGEKYFTKWMIHVPFFNLVRVEQEPLTLACDPRKVFLYSFSQIA